MCESLPPCLGERKYRVVCNEYEEEYFGETKNAMNDCVNAENSGLDKPNRERHHEPTLRNSTDDPEHPDADRQGLKGMNTRD